MSDIQDAAPSSTEPVAQADSQQAPQEPSQGNAVGGACDEQSQAATSVTSATGTAGATDSAGGNAASSGEPAGGASDPAAPGSSGTTVETTDTPSSTIGETQTNQSSNESPSTTSSDGTAGDAGNAAGQTDSADSATPTDNAPLSAATADAVATFADLMGQFETRQYPNGVMMRTLGELPKESPVSYPRPETPADNSPHGLLNQIEAYFTTALRSSRTDGHKLIAQLRAALS